jgi:hypothetical protein
LAQKQGAMMTITTFSSRGRPLSSKKQAASVILAASTYTDTTTYRFCALAFLDVYPS